MCVDQWVRNISFFEKFCERIPKKMIPDAETNANTYAEIPMIRKKDVYFIK